MSRMTDSARDENMLSALRSASGLGEAMRLDGLRKENARAWAEVERLRAALEGCLIGGNHLANVLIGNFGGDFATKYPPSMSEQDALQQMKWCGDAYDVWTCWASIMQARGALDNQQQTSGK